MSFGKSRVASLLVALSIAGIAPLHGQVTVGLDAGLYTHYVWRGVSEIDYWLEYGFSFEKADLSVGAVYYTFHGLPDIGDGNTAEVYANVTLTALPVEPSLAVFYDLDNVRGAYLEGSVGYSLPVGSGHSLDLGVLGASAPDRKRTASC